MFILSTIQLLFNDLLQDLFMQNIIFFYVVFNIQCIFNIICLSVKSV